MSKQENDGKYDSDSDYIDDTENRKDSSKNNSINNKRSSNGIKTIELSNGGSGYSWEDEYQRSWDIVKEDAKGSLSGMVKNLIQIENEKSRRRLRDTTSLQRGIIRYLVLVLDMSVVMAEKDLRPTRAILTLMYASDFVKEYFEQNPISQLAILVLCDGICSILSPMSGNPFAHISALDAARGKKDTDFDPTDSDNFTSNGDINTDGNINTTNKNSNKNINNNLNNSMISTPIIPHGDPSLQNALEMIHGLLFHMPSHGTREALIIYGALFSADPGDIHSSINSLIKDNIRVRIIGLAAQVAICKEICLKTNPPSVPINSTYFISLNEGHFKEILSSITSPPPKAGDANKNKNSNPNSSKDPNKNYSSLIKMGFPSRLVSPIPILSSLDSNPARKGYLCPNCNAFVTLLPTECPICSLTLILSTHLARSYHHLMPLQNWYSVSYKNAFNSNIKNCYSCKIKFPALKKLITDEENDKLSSKDLNEKKEKDVISASTYTYRYACPTCKNHFCVECDIFAHETLHNCPGCQSSYS